MAGSAQTTIVLDVGGLPCDVTTIDALARFQLAARRRGQRLRLRAASDELRSLIGFVGLGGVLGSDSLGACVADAERVDRSVQTDARARPARPEAGIASDALCVEARREAEEREELLRVEEERKLDDPAD